MAWCPSRGSVEERTESGHQVLDAPERDKYFASGEFEEVKAGLVAEGDQQDKTLYEDLAEPTVATAYVLIIAGLAAEEGRTVVSIDIGGAFLNADMASSGVTVHMQLYATMTVILVKVR